MSWRDTETDAPKKSWRDTEVDVHDDVSQLESALRGAAQGASFGFADELTGALESAFTDKSYEQARDESRANYKSAQESNPGTYIAGDVAGALGTAFVPGLGWMNAAKGAKVASVIGKGALQGALSGAGMSEANNASDLAKDTAIGAGIGGASGVAGKYVLEPGMEAVGRRVIAPVAEGTGKVVDTVLSPFYNPDGTVNKIVSKAGSFLSGVDDEAILRQIQRPTGVSKAEADAFAYNTGVEAVDYVDKVLHTRGMLVNKKSKQFLENRGEESFKEPISQIASDISEFLEVHKPSPKGFSALAEQEIEALENMVSKLKEGDFTGEDVFKFRQYLDHVERLAGKYDVEGKGPFIRFLKNIRGKADEVLDTHDKALDYANREYSNAKRDVDLLRPFTDESRAEGLVNNLYGKNKTGKQKAAENLFLAEKKGLPDSNRETRGESILNKIKDISANKAFDNAKGPAGSEFGIRQLGGVILSGGLSIPFTSPSAWKHGSRAWGRLQSMLQNNPERLGKFANFLTQKAQEGNNSLAVTHYILMQSNPEYRKQLEEIDKEE